MDMRELSVELYRLYPQHVGRGAAIKSIEKALKRLPLELKLAGQEISDCGAWMKERVAMFANSPAGHKDGLFRGYRPPYPTTWFNQTRYLDDVEAWFDVSISREEEQDMRMRAEANVGVWRPQ